QGKKMLFTQDETLMKKDLKEMEKYIKAMDVSVDYELSSRAGEARQVILEVESQIDPEFILIPSHSHTLIKRVFLGSTTRHVLNNARGPVYIYRKPAKKFNLIFIVPVDYSDTNKGLIELADRWAQKSNAELMFIHVSDLPEIEDEKKDFTWEWHQRLSDDMAVKEQLKDEREKQKKKLDHYVAQFEIISKYRTVLEFGRSYEKVIELQEMTDAILIIVAANSSYEKMQNAVGRTAKTLIYDSPCSVFLYKQG
ncbi:MAG: universal stress protein, partial [bacterium]